VPTHGEHYPPVVRSRRGDVPPEATALRQELAQQASLVEAVRRDLYSVEPRHRRSLATTALSASIAERTFRLTEPLSDLHNEASEQWRRTLERVWLWLAGDEQQHYALSAAVANYLRSPLNHVEGQGGPNDMDRPQTVAALAATVSALHWGVDSAEDALAGLFEAVDLKYDQQFGPAREAEFRTLARGVREDATALRKALRTDRAITPDLLARLRR